MATTNYIDKKVYALNDDGLVYVVESVTNYNNGCDYMQVNLKLVAGLDYVNPDESDVQGWCSADNFIDDVQDEYVMQHFITESMIEALEESGYTIIEHAPNITSIK